MAFNKDQFIEDLKNMTVLELKEVVEAILWECTSELRELYEKARWGNGQKWLMIDLEDQGEMFADVLQLIEIRRR